MELTSKRIGEKITVFYEHPSPMLTNGSHPARCFRFFMSNQKICCIYI